MVKCLFICLLNSEENLNILFMLNNSLLYLLLIMRFQLQKIKNLEYKIYKQIILSWKINVPKFQTRFEKNRDF